MFKHVIVRKPARSMIDGITSAPELGKPDYELAVKQHDAYIEALVAQIGSNYNVRVVTSDALIQLSSLRSGVLRMSARELKEEVETARKEMGKHFRK